VNPLLAKISPFLLAIQSQQHFATSPFFPQSQMDPSTFFGHHSLLHSLNSSQQASTHLEVLEDGTEQLQHDDERDEADSEGTTTAGQHQQRTAEPEDLSIKLVRRLDKNNELIKFLGVVELQLKRIATAAVGAVLVGTRAVDVELSNPCGTMKSILNRLAEC
jgi:hypothetical protein